MHPLCTASGFRIAQASALSLALMAVGCADDPPARVSKGTPCTGEACCLAGQVFDPESSTCVCPDDLVADPATGACVADPCAPNPCREENKHVCVVVAGGDHGCECDFGFLPQGSACVLDETHSGESCDDPRPLNPAGGSTSGSTASADNDATGSCGGDGPELVYSITLASPARFTALMAGYDTVLHLRSTCTGAASEMECDDDYDSAGGPSRIVADLEPGTYYLFADSFAEGGSFTLTYSVLNPCNGNSCGEAQCVPNSSWTSYTCVCQEGMRPWDGGCVDDPCLPNPCVESHRTICAPSLPEDFSCACDPGFVDDGSDCVEDTELPEWTILVFMNGDNDLETDAYGDVTEMGLVGSNAEVNILVLLDSYDRDSGAARKLYVTDGGTTVLENMGEIDMGDWHELADFGVWGVQTYPARHFALVMWDHGDGWKSSRQPLTKGFSMDYQSGNEILISNGDYGSALAQITAAAGRKLDIIGFDACLMGMWELAEASAPYGDLFIGSEETEPTSGWNWDYVLGPLVANPTRTATEIAIDVVEGYYADGEWNSTMSAVDLGSMDQLATALSALADAMREDTGAHSTIESLRNSTVSFSENAFRDLGNFAERAAASSTLSESIITAAAALVTQVDASVVYVRNQSEYGSAHGLSIYFPSYGSSYDSDYRDSGAVWCRTSWDEFVAAYTN